MQTVTNNIIIVARSVFFFVSFQNEIEKSKIHTKKFSAFILRRLEYGDDENEQKTIKIQYKFSFYFSPLKKNSFFFVKKKKSNNSNSRDTMQHCYINKVIMNSFSFAICISIQTIDFCMLVF